MMSSVLSNGIRAGSNTDSYPHVTTQMMLAMLADLNVSKEKSQKPTIYMEQKCVEIDQKLTERNPSLQTHVALLERNADEQRQVLHEQRMTIQHINDHFDRLEMLLAQLIENEMEQKVHEYDSSSASAAQIPVTKDPANVSPSTPLSLFPGTGDGILPLPSPPPLIRQDPGQVNQTHSNSKLRNEILSPNQVQSSLVSENEPPTKKKIKINKEKLVLPSIIQIGNGQDELLVMKGLVKFKAKIGFMNDLKWKYLSQYEKIQQGIDTNFALFTDFETYHARLRRKKNNPLTTSKHLCVYHDRDFLKGFMRNQYDRGRRLVIDTVDFSEVHLLRNVLWGDANGFGDYKSFSDVVSLDTTYLVNRYKVLFVGVNHHVHPVLLGCGLIADETVYTYVWLMQSWLVAMGGQTPKVMILELITRRHPVYLTGEMEDSLVDWARHLCLKAAQDGDYSQLADPYLELNYNQQKMARMASCAAAVIRHSARRRPKMSQIGRALEGDVSMEELSDKTRPGQNTYLSPGGVNSKYEASSYNANINKFRELALESKAYQSSEYAGTSDFRTLRYSTALDNERLVVCERSLIFATGGPNVSLSSSFVRVKRLSRGFLNHPCIGGGSMIHIVNHVDLDVSSVSEVLRPLYESSKILAQKMIVAALRHVRQIAQETSGEDQLRISRCESFLGIFEREGCKMVDISCVDHDKFAAGSQFITHMLGRILQMLKRQFTPIITKGYGALLELAENLLEMLEKMELAIQALREELFGQLHGVVRKQLFEGEAQKAHSHHNEASLKITRSTGVSPKYEYNAQLSGSINDSPRLISNGGVDISISDIANGGKSERYPNAHLEDKVSSKGDGIDRLLCH